MKLQSKHPLITLGVLSALGLAVATTAQAEIRPHTLRLGASDAENSSGPVASRKFAELIAQKSGGKIKIKTYHSSMLGNDTQMLGALQGGTLDFALPGTPAVGGLVKEFSLLDLPMMFRNSQEADKMLDGPMGKQLLGKLEGKGIVGLGFWELGFRAITNNKHPVSKWEDMSGIKIRTPMSPVSIDYFASLGATPSPMPVGEVYTALETGAIDAQEHPLVVTYNLKFYEVQKYLTLSNHGYTPYALLASKQVWDKLNPDEQKLIRAAADEAKAFERNYSRSNSARMIAELKKKVTVTELSPQEQARFQEKAKPIYAKFSESIDPAFAKSWFATLQSLR